MAMTHWKPFRDIERWEPFREVESLRREMDRLFDRFASSFDGGHERLTFLPAAEMDETDDAIYLKLEVPGLEAKDLHVEVTEDSVSITGERKSEAKMEEKGVTHSEFHYGKFERRISLPTQVQNDKVNAEYKNGILNLTLPKSEEEKRKVVKINVG